MMSKPFNDDILLVTSPNAGGTCLVSSGVVTILDCEDATGVWTSPDIVLRNVIADIGDGHEYRMMQLQCFSRSTASLQILCSDATYDFHDLLIYKNKIYLVSTGTNEVMCFDCAGSLLKKHAFPGGNDSWHINCLGVWDGRVVLSAFGDFDTLRGYKGKSANRGFVIDLETRALIWDGLSQPHTPVQVQDRYVVCDSETGRVLSRKSGSDQVSFDLGAYTRGLAASENHFYVGLSQSRNVELSGDEGKARIVALSLETGEVLDEVKIPFDEIYAIRLVPIDHLAAVLATFVKPNLGRDLRKQINQVALLSDEFGRINKHPVAGAVLNGLRFLKKDRKFADPLARDGSK